MPLRNRFVLACLQVLLAAGVGIWLTPFAVSNGVRLWVSWRARQEGFIATVDKIDAPFLRPVVIRHLYLRSMRDNGLRVDLTATDAQFDLNFKHILLHMRGHTSGNLSILKLRGELSRSPQ